MEVKKEDMRRKEKGEKRGEKRRMKKDTACYN